MEQPSQDPAVMETAFQAAVGNRDSDYQLRTRGGKRAGTKRTSSQEVRRFTRSTVADGARKYGVDALREGLDVGSAIDNTPDDATGDGRHRFPQLRNRHGPIPHPPRRGRSCPWLSKQSSPRVKHVHIRDCLGRQQGPGKPEMQANGRGEIDLPGYMRVLADHGYTGPVDLEIIGAKDYRLEQCCTIAAESRGHMNALHAFRSSLGHEGAPPEMKGPHSLGIPSS